MTTTEAGNNTCNLHLFCPKYDVDNPYYSPNHRLHALAGMVSTLIRNHSAELIKISGGHRSRLKNNCEAVLKLPLADETSIDEIERTLIELMDDSLVEFRISETDKGTSETEDVE